MPDVVEVVQVVGLVVEIPAVIAAVVEVPAVVGPRGPAGSGAIEVPFVNLATWLHVHNLGRRPSFTLLDADGHPFACGAVLVTASLISVNLPSALTGTIIIC